MKDYFIALYITIKLRNQILLQIVELAAIVAVASFHLSDKKFIKSTTSFLSA